MGEEENSSIETFVNYFNVIRYVIEKLAFGPKKIYEMHVKFVFLRQYPI